MLVQRCCGGVCESVDLVASITLIESINLNLSTRQSTLCRSKKCVIFPLCVHRVPPSHLQRHQRCFLSPSSNVKAGGIWRLRRRRRVQPREPQVLGQLRPAEAEAGWGTKLWIRHDVTRNITENLHEPSLAVLSHEFFGILPIIVRASPARSLGDVPSSHRHVGLPLEHSNGLSGRSQNFGAAWANLDLPFHESRWVFFARALVGRSGRARVRGARVSLIWGA